MTQGYKTYPQPADIIRSMEERLVKSTLTAIEERHTVPYLVPDEFHEDTVTFRHHFTARVTRRSGAWLAIKKTLEDRGWLHVDLEDLGRSFTYSLTVDGKPNV